METNTLVTDDNLINAVQNEPTLWDSASNASEEDKDLAWKRIGDAIIMSSSSADSAIFDEYRSVHRVRSHT